MADQEPNSRLWISIAALGAWQELPDVSGKMDLSLEPVEDSWREDLIQQGWDNKVFEKPILKQLRKLDQVIFGELSFCPYIEDVEQDRFPSRQLRWAKTTAKTLKQLSHKGAKALYFDGSMKTYTPDMFDQLDLNDIATLFHLFIEILGDEISLSTEGMFIFGLPEICIAGLDPQSPTAQATVFSLAAQMVCEEFKVLTGQKFRASESFPWCEINWISEPLEARAYLSNLLGNQLELAETEDKTNEYLCGLVVVKPL